MIDANIYFGLPGKLRQIYDPFGGMVVQRVIQRSVFNTASGGARVQRALRGVRTYTLNYELLGYENFAYLEAIEQGHYGPGPFVLLDPGQRNLLTVNQASSGSDSNDARDFTVTGIGGSLSAVSGAAGALPKSVLWQFATATPASAFLALDAPAPDWPGIPVAPRPYSFGFSAQGGGTDGIVQLTPNFTWFDINGAVLSTPTGPAINTSPTLPVYFKQENVIPPIGACFVTLGITATPAGIAAGDQVSLYGFQFNEGTTVDVQWTPGTGVLPVEPMSLANSMPHGEPGFRRSPALVLQEVV